MSNELQGTPEWHAARCGKVTASRIADVMASGKGGAESVTRRNYMAELIAERLTGVQVEGYRSADMDHGKETEDEARLAYEFQTGLVVQSVGFIDHPTIAMCGASPDGLAGDLGLVEIKCPKTANHIDTRLGASIDRRYIMQMQWQMAVTGRAWCDFVSFDPRLPAELSLFIKRIDRDDETIATIEAAISAFNAEIEAKIGQLTAKPEQVAA